MMSRELHFRIPFVFFILASLFFSAVIHAQSTTTVSLPHTTTSFPTTAGKTLVSVGNSASSGSSHSGSGSGSGSGSSQSHASATISVSVNPVDPPGGVVMISPAASDSGSTYYKIGETVTLSWSYTDVQVTPTAVAVEAYCAINKFYYPVAQNLTYDETNIVWDTEAYDANATQPLLTAMYTLYIYDESRAVTAIPSAGILGSFNGFVFGLYQPQPYTPLPTNTCVICSGARKMLPREIWLGLGISVAFVVGGWRVVAG